MSLTTIKLSQLPAAVRDQAVLDGRLRGRWVELRTEDYLRLANPTPASVRSFPGITKRTHEQQAACLAICSTCDRLSDGRCKLCKVCGGTRRVADWVVLTSHRCPKGLW